jgi:hypothetical protein
MPGLFLSLSRILAELRERTRGTIQKEGHPISCHFEPKRVEKGLPTTQPAWIHRNLSLDSLKEYENGEDWQSFSGLGVQSCSMRLKSVKEFGLMKLDGRESLSLMVIE